ncbi:hypothetical protein AAHA92_04027 [Salvia divinorum]|uniref:Uncharacterized protein n=1 Tax=Salvia divinorum TaxID=28513 RepID=A0ABD1I146_SALDI
MSGIVGLYCVSISCFCMIGGFRSGFAFDLNFECRILNLLGLIECISKESTRSLGCVCNWNWIIWGLRSRIMFGVRLFYYRSLACGLIAVSKSGASQRKKDRNSAPLVGCMPLKSHQANKRRSEDCQFSGPAPFLWNSYDFEGVTLTGQDAFPY